MIWLLATSPIYFTGHIKNKAVVNVEKLTIP